MSEAVLAGGLRRQSINLDFKGGLVAATVRRHRRLYRDFITWLSSDKHVIVLRKPKQRRLD
jgi:hypothetical protein